MKLYYEPEVYLITRQQVEYDTLDHFLGSIDNTTWYSQAATAADGIPEIAGRLCYLSYQNPRPGGNSAYLEHILESGHGSVLEHSVFGFIFAGVSRSLTHELVRHRTGTAFSQVSQRYVDSSDVGFVVPHELQPEVRAYLDTDNNIEPFSFKDTDVIRAGREWYASCEDALEAYRSLTEYLSNKLADVEDKTLRRKMARQTARSVLPNCTETKIFMTGNVRAWRHILEQRGSRHAEVEIRRLTNKLLPILQREAPNLFADYTMEQLPDGTFEINTPYRKV